jgi:hypothetical protein
MPKTFGLFFLKPSRLHNSFAYVYLNAFSQNDGPTKGLQLLTAQAFSMREFNEQINCLIDELEKLRKKGDAEFALAV